MVVACKIHMPVSQELDKGLTNLRILPGKHSICPALELFISSSLTHSLLPASHQVPDHLVQVVQCDVQQLLRKLPGLAV